MTMTRKFRPGDMVRGKRDENNIYKGGLHGGVVDSSYIVCVVLDSDLLLVINEVMFGQARILTPSGQVGWISEGWLLHVF